MSGHSHARTVKHDKDIADSQRSKVFSKLAAEITVAVTQGGGDSDANPRLRTAIERARAANMPSDNVERAAKKGAGEDRTGQLEEFLLEAYGPGGVALLISGITDNKNRMLGEIKQTLSKNHGKMVEGGAVRWLFSQKGIMAVKGAMQKEELELKAIEAGAEDLYWREDGMLNVYTKPTELEKIKNSLQAAGLSVGEVSIDWVPKEGAEVAQKDLEAAQKLFDELNENDSVQGVYSNLKS